MKKTPSDKDWVTFGGRMRWARSQSGMTQKAAANAVGVAQPTLSELEGSHSVGSSHTSSFAAIYGVDPEWLTSGKGAPKRRAKTGTEEKINMLNPKRRALLESLLDDWLAEDGH